jgi:hypothetical protein
MELKVFFGRNSVCVLGAENIGIPFQTLLGRETLGIPFRFCFVEAVRVIIEAVKVLKEAMLVLANQFLFWKVL